MSIVVPIVIAVIFSAFFSGMEIAFLTSNKLKIELDNKQGILTARVLSRFLKRPGRFIGSLLVGNNIALVLYGIFMAQLLDPVLNRIGLGAIWIMVIQTFLSTLLILISGEFLPKTLFRINPNFILSIFAIPMVVIYYLLFLPMIITVGLAEWLLRVFFHVEKTQKEIVFGRVDLDNYVREMTLSAENTKSQLDHELQILQNALDFSSLKARDCMVPRPEIVALELEDEVEELKQRFVQTGLSKILIYRDSIDNIIGYVNSIDLFKRPKAIKNMLQPVLIIPKTVPANEILEMFIQQRKGIAVVVDEFGGTSGMLTIEDIIEEIFGDIEDEHDVDQFIEKKISDKEYVFSARLEVDYINDTYKLNIPESEEYDTLAGLLLYYNEDIPTRGSTINIERFSFVITAVTNARIQEVKLILKEEE